MQVVKCRACGEHIEVDKSLGVIVSVEAMSSQSPGRGSITEGGEVVHQCRPGTYKSPVG